MTKDVHEEPAIGIQPIADPTEQLFIIAHVFQHFDGYDPVVSRRRFEVVHVAGQYFDISKAAPSGFGDDVLALAV
jgi:hypothetical protein